MMVLRVVAVVLMLELMRVLGGDNRDLDVIVVMSFEGLAIIVWVYIVIVVVI